MRRIKPHSAFLVSVVLSGLLASIGLVGGLSIQLVKQEVITLLPLLVALPAMNAMAGDYAALTAAHLGDPENYGQQTRRLALALLISLPVSCIGVSAMSLGIAHLKGYELTARFATEYSLRISLMFIIVTVSMFGIIYLTNRLLSVRNINTDDTLIPLSNTLASVLVLIGFAIIANQL